MSNGRRHAKKLETFHWTYGSWSQGATAAGTSAATVFPAQHLPETLVRMRGESMVYVDATSAPGSLASIGVGLILVPEGTGTTVLWSPITDGDAPWIWVNYDMIGYEEMVVDTVDIPGLTSSRTIIDSKAMRRIRNQEVQIVVENATVLTAENVNIFGQVRLLAGS